MKRSAGEKRIKKITKLMLIGVATMIAALIVLSGSEPVAAQNPPGGGGSSGGTPGYKISWTQTNGLSVSTGSIGSFFKYWPTDGTTATNSDTIATGGLAPQPGGGWPVGPGTTNMEGDLVATFTWDDAGTDMPAPKVVVLKESAVAIWVGDEGSASCGLPNATNTTYTFSGSSVGYRWSVKQNLDSSGEPTPLNSFDVSVSPSASCTLFEESESELLAGKRRSTTKSRHGPHVCA